MPPAARIAILSEEVLSGDAMDRHGPLLAETLKLAGMKTAAIAVLGGDDGRLDEWLAAAFNEKEIGAIIVAGGRRVSSADRVSRSAGRVTGCRRVVSDELLRHFARNRERDGGTEREALVPQKAAVFTGAGGPEFGYSLRHRGKLLVYLSGGPEEAAAVARESLLPCLLAEFGDLSPVRRGTFHLFGLSVDEAMARLEGLSPEAAGISISAVSAPAETVATLIVSGEGASERFEPLAGEVRRRLGADLFGENGETLEEAVAKLLKEKGETLSLAESCTGGGIGYRMTRLPGSSEYFVMGAVAYANDAKTKLLGVQPTVIEEHGAVSAETALAMATGAKRFGMTGYGLAVTGIAGPSGGNSDKPVGTVYIALASDAGTCCERFHFDGNREAVRELAIRSALDMLRRNLLSF